MTLEAVDRAAGTPAGQPVHRRKLAGSWANQIALTVVLVLFMSPLVWMIVTSLKPAADVFGTPPSLIPRSIEWGNYTRIWSFLNFDRFLINSFLVASIGTVIVIGASACSAYAFSRLRWRGRDKIFVAFLGTLMIPQEVVVVPMYIFMTELGWVDSYKALILPWAFTAFGSFALRQTFLSIPNELEEAAKVDGARHATILWRIMMPIARPTVAVLAVFTFIGYWNAFLWPLIVINSRDKFTVPVGLNLFLGQQGQQWHLLMAAATVSTMPIIILTIVMRKHLIRGFATSGLGGR